MSGEYSRNKRPDHPGICQRDLQVRLIPIDIEPRIMYFLESPQDRPPKLVDRPKIYLR